MEFLPRAPDPEEIIIGNDADEDDGLAGCGDELDRKTEAEDEINHVVDESALEANESKEKKEETEKTE